MFGAASDTLYPAGLQCGATVGSLSLLADMWSLGEQLVTATLYIWCHDEQTVSSGLLLVPA